MLIWVYIVSNGNNFWVFIEKFILEKDLREKNFFIENVYFEWVILVIFFFNKFEIKIILKFWKYFYKIL